MKKSWIFVCLIILSFLVVGFGSYIVYDKIICKPSQKKLVPELTPTSNLDNKVNKIHEIDDNKVNKIHEIDDIYTYTSTGEIEYTLQNGENWTFYKNGIEINKYICKATQCLINYSLNKANKNKFVLISLCDKETCDYASYYGGMVNFYISVTPNTSDIGSGTILLYDIETGSSIEFKNVLSAMLGDENMWILKYTSDNFGIITLDGIVNRDMNNTEPILTCYEGCYVAFKSYNYDKNILVTKQKNTGKYGIEKLSTGEVIIDHNYDEINLSRFLGPIDINYDQYFIGKLNGKNNLYNISNGEAITKNGYDQIYVLDDTTFMAYENQYISFKNLTEEDVITEKIKVEKLYGFWPKNPTGIRVHRDDDIITFTVEEETSNNNTEEASSFHTKISYYTYNLKTKELAETNDRTYGY